MDVIYFQPRVNAEKNYRQTDDGAEQVWTPWWALLLHQYARQVAPEAWLVDARVDSAWPARLAELIGPGTVLAVSVMTGHAIKDAIEASQIARALGATVIWGGTHTTLFPGQVRSQDYVDYVVQGFGAKSFGVLLGILAKRGNRAAEPIVDSRGAASGVPVTISRHPGDSAPFQPAIELVNDWAPYTNTDQAIGDRAVNLITSEGCLRRCTFCSEPATSRNSWLVYDVTQCVQVARTITALASANGLKLHDPNFLQDVDRGLRFASLVRSEVGLPWAATIHPADLLALPEEVLARLTEAGLRRVLVGLEAAEQELVNLAGKKYPVAQIPVIADKLARHGVAGMFTFIVGWPGAGPGHYQTTIDTAFEIRGRSSIHQAKIHFLEPWPGTPIRKYMQRTMQLPEFSLTEWAEVDYYFAHHPQLHAAEWEPVIRAANEELSPYVEA